MPATMARLRKVEAMAKARLVRPHPRLAAYRNDPGLLMSDAGLAPDPWQQDLLRDGHRRVLLLASRQVGKSQTAAFLILTQALRVPGSTILITAPSERQSKDLLEATRKPGLTPPG